jgi:hypothetical protein
LDSLIGTFGFCDIDGGSALERRSSKEIAKSIHGSPLLACIEQVSVRWGDPVIINVSRLGAVLRDGVKMLFLYFVTVV